LCSGRSKGKRCGDATTVCDAAGGYDRHFDSINNLWDQRQGPWL
jgi:hypothetical protein